MSRLVSCAAFAAVAFASGLEGIALADGLPPRRLVPPGLETFDRFGVSAAISGDIVLAGAHNYELDGAAFRYDLGSDDQPSILEPFGLDRSKFFGYSLGLSGDTAIIGEWFAFGTALLFDARSGTGLHQLFAEDEDFNDRFGEAVAISGQTAIVGAAKNSDSGFESGSAYLFDVATGQQTFKLLANDDTPRDNFGVSVAIHDEVALVGSWRDSHSGVRIAGSAYLFDVETGRQRFKLVAEDADEDDEFGISVAINDDYAVIGARDEGLGGAAYVFDPTTGEQMMKLVADDVAEEDRFGHSVAISGDLALIGSPSSDTRGEDSGAAYLFDLRTGQQLLRLTAFDGAAGDEFGQSVAIEGTTAVVGAWRVDGAFEDTGAVYFFRVPEPSSLFCVACLVVAAATSRGGCR